MMNFVKQPLWYILIITSKLWFFWTFSHLNNTTGFLLTLCIDYIINAVVNEPHVLGFICVTWNQVECLGDPYDIFEKAYCVWWYQYEISVISRVMLFLNHARSRCIMNFKELKTSWHLILLLDWILSPTAIWQGFDMNGLCYMDIKNYGCLYPNIYLIWYYS